MKRVTMQPKTWFLITALATIGAVLLFFWVVNKPDITPSDRIQQLTRWHDAQGTHTLPILTEKTVGSTHMMSATIPTLETSSHLIFRTENIRVNVLVDGRPYYTMPPVLAHQTLGDQWHYVYLPPTSQGKLVTIESTRLFANASGDIRVVYLATRGDFLQRMLSRKLTSYMVSGIIFLLGFLYLIGSSLITRPLGVHAPVSFAFFCLIMGAWCMVQTGVPELLFGITPLTHFVAYATLPLAVAMLSLYLGSLPAPRWLKHVYRGIGIVGAVEFGVGIALEELHILAYVETLPFVRASMGVVVSLFIVQLPWLLKSYKDYYFFLCGLSCLVFTYIADVAGMSIGTYDYARNTRFGLFWLTLLVTVQYSIQVRNSIKRADQADIMRRLAYRDTLTGLRNRLALVRDQEALLTQNEACVGIVQMDINNLKQVNDLYGHEEGDALIRRAANAILQAFGDKGTSYRVGGDEFVTLITKDACEATYHDCVKRLALATARQNEHQDHQLSIALGFATYQPAMGDRFYDLVRVADMRMYARKREMKGIDNLTDLEVQKILQGDPDWKSEQFDDFPTCAMPHKPAPKRWWQRRKE